ncbi:hypothetical protein COCSUDRAFT_56336 [Coccomyxa subellipsoidea C-169]|uniref:DRBM domain-containing protein n=1 Tax=Coccomyxa subellipsoidea (strain C-169) TaxID=574566 RepID=I0YU20_COCSC|nr:hypothetical protein COCSUDRAFT_56336 [Coccomyxa subellipsoidea C-169]EIE21889.1 hypothetical protein COCSUDRAFT_56336 [Coccomyxa subellipsoidea C-169]|eukprot:XP_005646433.1 hypothetical protein COCSUDRAFT_56336 [Coccomyxa subellipsoidea C-169]
MPSRAKRAAAGAPQGAAQYYPGNRSLAAPKQHYPDTAPGPGTVPAQLLPTASFPALPSQQEFAAALAQGPLQHLGAPEPYDPLRHGPVAQQVHSSSGGLSTFQFAAGAAQPMPAMRPVSIHQTETGTRAPPSQAGHPLAAAATRESAEQAAAQFFQSLSQQGIQGGPGGSSNSPAQPAGQATVNQANEDGMPASTVAAHAQTNGVKGPDAEGGVALADVIVWRRGQWVGPSPREHMLEWSLKHMLPRPCYDVMQSSDAPSLFQATCILPHLALQVTPVVPYAAPEDAEQNAALMAIVYIEGALAKDSAMCTLTRVGQPALPGWTPVQVNSPALPSHAQLVKEMLDQEFEVRKVALGKEQDMLKIQQEALLQGGPNAQSIAANLFKELNDPGGTEDGPALKKQRMQAPQVKGPVQELKEFCEKHKWQLPTYEFSPGPEGRGYVCRLTLPDANISGMQSGLQPNQKAAKAEVSVDGLKVAHIYAAQEEQS